MTNTKIVITKTLKVKAGMKILFSNLNLTFQIGEITVFIGENGVGKSTLLNQLCGIEKPKIGDVIINGYNTKILPDNIRANIVSSIAQFDTSCDDLFVEERIAHGLNSSLLTNKILKKIYILGEKLKILHLFGKQLCKLSGGERKLIHIARCLISEQAKIYILDEPFASLDVFYQERICFLLKNIVKNKKCIIISTHDINLAIRLACKIIILHKQKILAEGNPSKVINEKIIKILYETNFRIFNDNNGFRGVIMRSY